MGDYYEKSNGKLCVNCQSQEGMFTCHSTQYTTQENYVNTDNYDTPMKTFSKWENLFIRFFFTFVTFTILFTLFIAKPFSIIEIQGNGFWKVVQAYCIAFINSSLPLLVTVCLTAIITATLTAAVVSKE